MANDRILLTYVAADLLFVISGALLIIFALNTKVEATETPTLENIARDLLLNTCPLNGRKRCVLPIRVRLTRKQLR
jgi:hypothetical protein